MTAPTPISDNRAARRRESQRQLRSFAERLARSNPWHVDGVTSRCSFCRIAVAPDLPHERRAHRTDCLWIEVRGWLDRHRVEQ